jgi:hypothetical protein
MAAPPYVLGECVGEVRAEAGGFPDLGLRLRKRPFLASRATPLALSASEEWRGQVA